MFNEARKTSWGDGFLLDKTNKTYSTQSVFMRGAAHTRSIRPKDLGKEVCCPLTVLYTYILTAEGSGA